MSLRSKKRRLRGPQPLAPGRVEAPPPRLVLQLPSRPLHPLSRSQEPEARRKVRWADPGSQFVRFVGSAEREGKAGGDQESPRARESWIIGLGVPTVAAASLRNGTADLQRKNLVRPRAARTGTVGGSAWPPRCPPSRFPAKRGEPGVSPAFLCPGKGHQNLPRAPSLPAAY